MQEKDYLELITFNAELHKLIKDFIKCSDDIQKFIFIGKAIQKIESKNKEYEKILNKIYEKESLEESNTEFNSMCDFIENNNNNNNNMDI